MKYKVERTLTNYFHDHQFSSISLEIKDHPYNPSSLTEIVKRPHLKSTTKLGTSGDRTAQLCPVFTNQQKET